MHVRHWNRLRTWTEEYMWKISTSLGDVGDLLLEFLWKKLGLAKDFYDPEVHKVRVRSKGLDDMQDAFGTFGGYGVNIGYPQCTCFLSSILPIAIAIPDVIGPFLQSVSSFFHREEDGRYSVAHSQYAATPHQHESLSCRWPGDDVAMTWRRKKGLPWHRSGLAATLLRLKEVRELKGAVITVMGTRDLTDCVYIYIIILHYIIINY